MCTRAFEITESEISKGNPFFACNYDQTVQPTQIHSWKYINHVGLSSIELSHYCHKDSLDNLWYIKKVGEFERDTFVMCVKLVYVVEHSRFLCCWYRLATPLFHPSHNANVWQRREMLRNNNTASVC